MGRRKIIIRQSVAHSIAEVAWYIESKGMIATAEKFTDAVYSFIYKLSDNLVVHSHCKDFERNFLGLKCMRFKKYSVVFIETENEITITEFLPSKMIR